MSVEPHPHALIKQVEKRLSKLEKTVAANSDSMQSRVYLIETTASGHSDKISKLEKEVRNVGTRSVFNERPSP